MSPTFPTYDFHALCEKLPMIGLTELDELEKDIRKYGLREQIALLNGKIIDGRNRYIVCKRMKYPLTIDHFKTLRPDTDALAYVISANIHRRHLTAEDKRNIIADLLKADPTKSNRQIGETAKVDHKTVETVRQGLEAGGEIPQQETVTGKDGVTQPKKKGSKKKPKGKSDKPEKVKLEYYEAVDPISANKTYQLFEQRLLDALEDLAALINFAYADEYARGTIEKLQDKLGALHPDRAEEGEEETQEAEAA
jgi:hypothetical protein